MTSHGYLGDPPQNPQNQIIKGFHWQCPLCPYDLTAVTEGGRRSLSNFHMERHLREDRERLVLFANAPARPPEYYNKLRLTWADIQFLRTRHIKIDAEIEWIDCQWCP